MLNPWRILRVLVLASLVSTAGAESLLFSYFGDEGAGLLLACSRDGLEFSPLNEGKPFLVPAVGNDKLLRDPCIARGPDGLFHMVWTTSWNDRGIGYAHSKDLLEWSEQRYQRDGIGTDGAELLGAGVILR